MTTFCLVKNDANVTHTALVSDVIGSDPTLRDAGFGHALMRSRLDRCDGARAPAYVEASKQELIPYYSRFGFEQIGEIDIPDGPTMIPMWRAPR